MVSREPEGRLPSDSFGSDYFGGEALKSWLCCGQRWPSELCERLQNLHCVKAGSITVFGFALFT